jgi:hypothetical protein
LSKYKHDETGSGEQVEAIANDWWFLWQGSQKTIRV